MEEADDSDCFASFGRSHRRIQSSPMSTSTPSSPYRSSFWDGKSAGGTTITTVNSSDNQRLRKTGGEERHGAQSIDPVPITLENHFRRLAVIAPSRTRHARGNSITYHARHMRPFPVVDACGNVNVGCEAELDLGHLTLTGLRAFMGQTKHLLSSCCLLESHAHQRTLVATTDDRVYEHVDRGASNKTPDATAGGFCLQSVQYSQSKHLFLLVERPVSNCRNGKNAFTMFARVDITGLLGQSGFLEHIDDVWLNLAAEEMSSTLTEKPHLLKYIPETNFLYTSPRLLPSIQQINELYQSFFVIESSPFPGGYEVTHMSSTNTPEKEQQMRGIANGIKEGQYKLARFLAGDYRFLFDARLEAKGAHEMVWCLPLAGLGLKCWICFLLHSVA